jgi:hypothetical protein
MAIDRSQRDKQRACPSMLRGMHAKPTNNGMNAAGGAEQ